MDHRESDDAASASGHPGRAGSNDATCYIERSEVRQIVLTALQDHQPGTCQGVLRRIDRLPIFTAGDFASSPVRKALEALKDSINTRINDLLCETKPNYDDSIVGINDAWDVVRKACQDHIDRAALTSSGGQR